MRPGKKKEDTIMSEEKKTAVTEEVKEEVRKLTEEELAQVSGGVKDLAAEPFGKTKSSGDDPSILT